MNRPAAKGWCPGALRPMESGDGLLVRVRPRLGRLTVDQVEALCAAANRHGSGLIDLTSRGNMQIRGVGHDAYDRLLVELEDAGLVDRDATEESRNNIIVTPLWQPGDETVRIATELGARLSELPDLPSKFGFAVDAGDRPILTTASADVRVERSTAGALIVRLDGASTGVLLTLERVFDHVIALGHWFVDTGGRSSRRRARHPERPPADEGAAFEPPAAAVAALTPGPAAGGAVYGAPFGSMVATDLERLVRASGAVALRTTPWRLFVLEGGQTIASDTFIADPGDRLLDVAACPGAPHCPAATVDTRQLARELAEAVTGPLHVSGCAKGCARPSSAPVTVVGRAGKFDIVRDGRAWDLPEITGLDPADVRSQLGND